MRFERKQVAIVTFVAGLTAATTAGVVRDNDNRLNAYQQGRVHEQLGQGNSSLLQTLQLIDPVPATLLEKFSMGIAGFGFAGILASRRRNPSNSSNNP